MGYLQANLATMYQEVDVKTLQKALTSSISMPYVCLIRLDKNSVSSTMCLSDLGWSTGKGPILTKSLQHLYDMAQEVCKMPYNQIIETKICFLTALVADFLCGNCNNMWLFKVTLSDPDTIQLIKLASTLRRVKTLCTKNIIQHNNESTLKVSQLSENLKATEYICAKLQSDLQEEKRIVSELQMELATHQELLLVANNELMSANQNSTAQNDDLLAKMFSNYHNVDKMLSYRNRNRMIMVDMVRLKQQHQDALLSCKLEQRLRKQAELKFESLFLDLKFFKEQNSELITQMDEFEQKYNLVFEKHQVLGQKCVQSSNNLVCLSDQIKKLKKQMIEEDEFNLQQTKELQKRIEALERENKAIENEGKSLNLKLKQMEKGKSNTKLEKKLQEYEKAHEEADKKRREQSNRADELQEKLTMCLREKKLIQTQLDKMEKPSKKNQNDKIKALEEEINDLKSLKRNCVFENQAFAERIKNLEKEKSTSDALIEQLKLQIEQKVEKPEPKKRKKVTDEPRRKVKVTELGSPELSLANLRKKRKLEQKTVPISSNKLGTALSFLNNDFKPIDIMGKLKAQQEK